MIGSKWPLTVLILCGGCTGLWKEHPMTVSEVIERRHELNGEVLLIRGWIDRCQGRSCLLYSKPKAQRGQDSSSWLSVGSNPRFDVQARKIESAEIILEGRFKAICFNDPMPPGQVEVCADRFGQVRPRRIIRVVRQANDRSLTPPSSASPPVPLPPTDGEMLES